MGIYIIYYCLGIVMLPEIILGIIAQAKVQNNFNKYNKVETIKGLTASRVARSMLDAGGCTDTNLVEIKGELTDNFNPKTNTVSLSKSVYGKSTIGAVGVAAHEIGHVFQHKEGYTPIKIRNALVPIINFSGFLVWPLIFIGIILEFIYYSTAASWLIIVGIALYGLNVLFCLITLPIEINASKRAYKMLVATGELTEEEAQGAKKVLTSAAWTYIAALITSILSLIRLLLLIFITRRNQD